MPNLHKALPSVKLAWAMRVWYDAEVAVFPGTTELVHRQVIESFNGNKALVLAALFGETLPQSKRNTEKRDLHRHG